MDYGIIKSEVRSNNENVAEEYYHFEVITRWWKNKESGITEWKHNIIRIDRDGSVVGYGATGEAIEHYWSLYHLEELMQPFASESPENNYKVRNRIAEQHGQIIRKCMG